MLKETFLKLLSNYTDNNRVTNDLWIEIEQHYSDKERHYHTLHHLDNVLAQLNRIKGELRDWDTMLFTLYYHDIIYNVQRSDNEEKSAELAEKRMKQIDVPDDSIELCTKQILATKSHLKSPNSDTNYFTDADLSILGHDPETYLLYSQNVRKEYTMYSDFDYNMGRKKVLNYFLAMERIFKTDFFYSKFETPARKNIVNELNRG
jgi:predicted metal-dependent HD superfamily phosphohydrolase